jgi:hypothetical protein
VAPNLVENPQAPAPLREHHVCPTAVIVTEAIGENWFRHTDTNSIRFSGLASTRPNQRRSTMSRSSKLNPFFQGEVGTTPSATPCGESSNQYGVAYGHGGRSAPEPADSSTNTTAQPHELRFETLRLLPAPQASPSTACGCGERFLSREWSSFVPVVRQQSGFSCASSGGAVTSRLRSLSGGSSGRSAVPRRSASAARLASTSRSPPCIEVAPRRAANGQPVLLHADLDPKPGQGQAAKQNRPDAGWASQAARSRSHRYRRRSVYA